MSNLDPDVAPEDAGRATPEIVVLALVALVVGLVTRFLTRSALWLDEALSVNISSLPISDIPSALRRDGHPPLYYVLLHGWTELFGTGDVAVRALSGLFGVATLVLVWFMGRRRGGTMLAWVLVAVVAVSPFAVRYSNEARMYALVMLLSVLGWFLLDDIVVRRRSGILRLGALALVAGALLWTHYWSMWLLGALVVGAVWMAWRRPADRRMWFSVVAAIAVGGLSFLPWVPTMLHQAATTGTPWAPPMRPTAAVSVTLADYAAGNYGEQALLAGLLLLAIVLGVFGVGRGVRSIELDLRTRPQVRREAVVVVLTMLIGTGIGLLSGNAYASRYSAVVLVFVMLLVAAGCTRFAARWVRLGVVAVLLAGLSIGAARNITYGRSQSEQLGRAIGDPVASGDVVVVCPDQLGPAMRRTVPAAVPIVAFPDGGDGRFVDWTDYAERNAASDPDAFARDVLADVGTDGDVWLVWSTSYETLEEKCAQLFAAFAARRPSVQVVAADGEAFFEHATLTRFTAPS